MQAIKNDNNVSGYLWTFAKTAWDNAGKESASKVFDNLVTTPSRNDLQATDIFFAFLTSALSGQEKPLAK